MVQIYNSQFMVQIYSSRLMVQIYNSQLMVQIYNSRLIVHSKSLTNISISKPWWTKYLPQPQSFESNIFATWWCKSLIIYAFHSSKYNRFATSGCIEIELSIRRVISSVRCHKMHIVELHISKSLYIWKYLWLLPNASPEMKFFVLSSIFRFLDEHSETICFCSR